MHIQVGFAIFSEVTGKFLAKSPDIGGPMSAPGYPSETKHLSDGFWLSTKEAEDFLKSIQKDYPTYKIVPVSIKA